MGKTRRRFENRWHRTIRGSKKIKIVKETIGLRHKAIPPDPWYAEPYIQKECLHIFKIAHRMMEKGWDREKIIHHLQKKFKVSYSDAREALPYEMGRNDDWTDKPK